MRSLIALTAALATCTALAEEIRTVAFNWTKPVPTASCELQDADGKQPALRFAGTVERSAAVGTACSVQIARRRFDALYRYCTVTNVDAVPREHYACWVMYSPTHVTFLYSYTEDLYGAPACEFACAVR